MAPNPLFDGYAIIALVMAIGLIFQIAGMF